MEAELAAAAEEIPLPGSDDEDRRADEVEVVGEQKVAPMIKAEKPKSGKSEKSEKARGKERAGEDST